MCGVIGLAFAQEEVAPALKKLAQKAQHRSHKSAGAVTYDVDRTLPYMVRGLGMVTEVLTPEKVAEMRGKIGIAHLRWATEGALEQHNIHPLSGTFQGKPFFVVHNGEISFRRALERQFYAYQPEITSDTKFFLALIEASGEENFEDALRYALRTVKGTYSLIVLYENTLYAVRDVTSNRPLYMGIKENMVCIVSETIAFRSLGIDPRHAEEIKGGQLVIVQGGDLSIEQKAFEGPPDIERTQKLCLIELIYSMHPSNIAYGRTVQKVREQLGWQLAQRWKPPADIVVGVPDSGIAAARGFAKASGIPYEEGLLRYHQSGRLFYSQKEEREAMYAIKYDPVIELLDGQRVALIDDTMFASETIRAVANIVLEAGAKEVHIGIPAPMIVDPCFYGTPTSSEHRRLIARDHMGDSERILEEIGASFEGRVKSLAFLPLPEVKQAIVSTKPMMSGYDITRENFCDACFLGGSRHIPVDIDGDLQPAPVEAN